MCFGFDIDSDALNICRHNVEEFEMNNIELVQLDVRKWAKADGHQFVKKFDTVIMNPPFGTRQQGIYIFSFKSLLLITFNVKEEVKPFHSDTVP